MILAYNYCLTKGLPSGLDFQNKKNKQTHRALRRRRHSVRRSELKMYAAGDILYSQSSADRSNFERLNDF